MRDYVEYVADRLVQDLGYEPFWFKENPVRLSFLVSTSHLLTTSAVHTHTEPG